MGWGGLKWIRLDSWIVDKVKADGDGEIFVGWDGDGVAVHYRVTL